MTRQPAGRFRVRDREVGHASCLSGHERDGITGRMRTATWQTHNAAKPTQSLQTEETGPDQPMT